jgi:hypothetical protein
LFDREDRKRGTEEALAVVRLALAEVLNAYNLSQDAGLARRLYYGVRNKIRPATKTAKQSDSVDLEEESLPMDTSRAIEAPDGASDELSQLWEGSLDPFEFLEKHRGGRIKEIDYQIFLKMSEGKSSAQIGAELGLAASSVRDRIQEVRRRLFGK